MSEIYADTNDSVKKVHEKRYETLKDRFKNEFKSLPSFYCRAPGRVNIIGEHIDYCGYSVLPAAIEQDFVMAYLPTDDDKIVIANVEGATYATVELSTDPYQKMWEDAHYVNYFLCGYKAILSHHKDIRE